MRFGKRAIRIALVVIVLAVVMAMLYAWLHPEHGPETPEYWLRLASAEALQSGSPDIHYEIVWAYGRLGDAEAARRAAQAYVDDGKESWLRRNVDKILVKMGVKKPAPPAAGWRMNNRCWIWAGVAEVQAKAGDPVAAKASADAIEVPGLVGASLRVHTYCIAALAFADAGDDARFRECIKLAEADAAVPDGREAERMQVYVAEALAKAGKIEEALAIAAGLPDGRARASALQGIVKGFGEKGNIEGLRRCREIAKSSTRDDASANDQIHLIACLVGQLARCGNLEEAMALAESSPDPRVAYMKIVRALADLGKTSQALQLTQTIDDDQTDWHTKAYARIAKAQAKAGNTAAARKTVLSIGLVTDRYPVYLFIAKLQAEKGDMAGYEETIRLAAAAVDGYQDNSEKARAYLVLASYSAKFGDTDNFRKFIGRAQACVDEMEDGKDRYKFRIHRAVVRAAAKAGDYDKALAFAEAIYQASKDTSAYVDIAAAQAAAGDFDAVNLTMKARPGSAARGSLPQSSRVASVPASAPPRA